MMNTTTSIILSDENYYSTEANRLFMSVSQYKEFMMCSAAALAKLNEEWEPDSDIACLLVGNYVHSYFESPEAHEKFKELNHDAMFSSRKPYGLLKTYQVAEDMIAALKRQHAFNKLYQGEKEHIVTGEILGVPWKAKIDCLNVEKGYFVDIKTTRAMKNKKFNERYVERMSWIVNYGYYLQMAVYAELLRQEFGRKFTPIICAVSKQSPPAVKMFKLDKSILVTEMEEMERNLDHVMSVKNGIEKPIMCGDPECQYCRGHYQVTYFSDTED